MSTKIRSSLSKNNKYWISKHRYYELKHRCLQYKEWEQELRYLDGVRSSSIMVPSECNTSDHTADTAQKRLYLTDMMDKIRRAAELSDKALGPFIFKAVTEDLSYVYLQTIMEIPCGRDMYYDRYRKFFWILDKM